MLSYMNLVVFALVASTVSPALSAPIRHVREQNLSHRANLAGEVIDAVPKKTWGQKLMRYGKEFLIGTGATMAFAYLFEKLDGSGSSKAAASATSDSSKSAKIANPPSTYPPSTYPPSTYPPSTYPTTANPPSTYPTSANPPSTYPPSTDPTVQTRDGYQQRAVDRDLPADIFEARSTSDNNNQNRRTASQGLSSRAELVEAIRLFSRMLDELD